MEILLSTLLLLVVVVVDIQMGEVVLQEDIELHPGFQYQQVQLLILLLLVVAVLQELLLIVVLLDKTPFSVL
jgi:hypothetical protein